MNLKKNVAASQTQIGDLKGKGYIIDMDKIGDRIMYTDKLPQTSEHRFQSTKELPSILSKYKKSDRSFDISKMSKRDPNFLINETSFGNQMILADKTIKRAIKG